MAKNNLTNIVIGGFLLYGFLSGIILYSYHQQTEALIEEQEKLAQSNRELNEKYENLLKALDRTPPGSDLHLEELKVAGNR